MPSGNIVRTLLMLALCALAGRAGSITYQVDQTVGVGTVTGFIETDGTIGTILSSSNILDWDLLLNDGTTAWGLLGPLSGSNSNFRVDGSDFSATATELLFNFSGTDHGFIAFEQTADQAFWCASPEACEIGTAGESLFTGNADQYTGLTGTQVIASVAGSGVPEPSAFGFLSLGLVAMRLLAARKTSAKSASEFR
jgi:hypothetical protein